MVKRKANLFKFFYALVLFLMPLAMAEDSFSATTENDTAPGRKLARQAANTKELWTTADHSKFEILKQEFKTGPEVTKACLTCHSEASAQFQKTIHWTWKDPRTINTSKLGKGGLSVNNF